MAEPSRDLPASSVLAAGSRFGNYHILERLGGGGMGEVYRAKDTRLGREVAIKTVLLEGGSRAESLQRFEQEARSASSLNHPNIVTIYELGQVDGTHYIAMELIGGETMRSMLAAGPIPFRKALDIAAQLADALAKAHEIGVVHRDLKPENIIINPDGVAKIVDFGLAKLLSASTPDTSSSSTYVGPCTEVGMVLGTAAYMSPEQANGDEVDFRSDQFAFGSVLYEMLTGRAAFRCKTKAETMAAILRDQPPSIVSMNVQAPAPLIWIVERCLAKQPKNRYASTRDLARDVAEVRERVAEVPTRAPEPRASNLPVQRTTFMGRESERTALRELVEREDARLITLTGPGGIGKTRLALQVANEVADRFPGGVCFVALSGVSDTGLILPAIAQAVGVRDTGVQSAQEGLKDYLASRTSPMLLLLDNFEHLVAAAAALAELLSISRTLKILVTSQAALHVYGEHEFPVPPLAVPDLGSLPPMQVLATLPAIALFVERASAVKRDFTLTKENAAAVAAICARLDGLPLAIELAAARVKLLSPAAMQSRLESCLHLLTGGARDLPMRQQTLRGTIDWSYRLLNEAEQTLFRRLAVFVGGCTLEGVEAVCDTNADLGLDVLDGMASMVDKSLVQQVEDAHGNPRFGMLTTIREYALECLAASGEEPRVRQAHAAYCIVLAEESANEDGTKQTEWLQTLEVEHDNLRAAVDWLTQTKHVEWGFRLGAALFRFWETREHLTEGRDRLEKLLAMSEPKPPKLHVRVLFAAGVLAGEQGDYAASHRLVHQSLEISRERHDNHGVAVALNALGVNARDRGELDRASSWFEESLRMWRELGDPLATARALSNLANITKLHGDYARAQSLYEECLAIFQKIEDGAGVAWTLNYLGDVARERSDPEAARSLYERSLEGFEKLDDSWGIASSLSDLGDLSRDQRRFEEAHRLYAKSMETFREVGHKRGIARVLESLAASFAAQLQPEQALAAAGSAAAIRQNIGGPLTPAQQAKLERALEVARQRLSPAAGMAAWMEGWTTPLEQAIEKALRPVRRESRPA